MEAVKGKLAFGFYDLLQWPHDCNLTIYVLLSIIQQLPKRIPKVFYLQLDNCFQENKNKYLLGFCALLVKLKKIKVNFLLVGHTHEDVSTFVGRVGAETLTGLQKATIQSFTPQPQVMMLNHLYDVHNWLALCLSDLHGHSQPHCYHFTPNQQDEAITHHRNWSYQTLSEVGVLLLKERSSGTLAFSTPSMEKIDLEHLKQDLPKWKPWLSANSWLEWADFLESGLEDMRKVPEPADEWPVDSICRLLAQQRSVSVSQPDHTDEALLTRERQECTVYPESLPQSTTAPIIEDISDLKAGQIVAVYCDNYSREPVIRNCTQVFDKDIEISWMEGTYTTSWTPWKIRDPQNHRKTIQWTDHVPKDSIIHFDFALTSTNHLQKATIQHLKKEYEE